MLSLQKTCLIRVTSFFGEYGRCYFSAHVGHMISRKYLSSVINNRVTRVPGMVQIAVDSHVINELSVYQRTAQPSKNTGNKTKRLDSGTSKFGSPSQFVVSGSMKFLVSYFLLSDCMKFHQSSHGNGSTYLVTKPRPNGEHLQNTSELHRHRKSGNKAMRGFGIRSPTWIIFHYITRGFVSILSFCCCTWKILLSLVFYPKSSARLSAHCCLFRAQKKIRVLSSTARQ